MNKFSVKTEMAMGQATAFNKTKAKFASSLYGSDSGWEDAMAGMDPKIDLETYSMFNERTSYTYEAVTTSAGMVSRVAGKGSAYLGSYYELIIIVSISSLIIQQHFSGLLRYMISQTV